MYKIKRNLSSFWFVFNHKPIFERSYLKKYTYVFIFSLSKMITVCGKKYSKFVLLFVTWKKLNFKFLQFGNIYPFVWMAACLVEYSKKSLCLKYRSLMWLDGVREMNPSNLWNFWECGRSELCLSGIPRETVGKVERQSRGVYTYNEIKTLALSSS